MNDRFECSDKRPLFTLSLCLYRPPHLCFALDERDTRTAAGQAATAARREPPFLPLFLEPSLAPLAHPSLLHRALLLLVVLAVISSAVIIALIVIGVAVVGIIFAIQNAVRLEKSGALTKIGQI